MKRVILFLVCMFSIVLINAGCFSWIARVIPLAASVIEETVVHVGSVVVVAGTKLFTENSENKIDYTVPHLAGELGDCYELYERQFIFTKDGWMLASEVTVEDIRAMEEEVLAEIAEPECICVGKGGWANDGTLCVPTGAKLYKECCTIDIEKNEIPYYDLERDARITQDFQQKHSEQKRKREKIRSLSSGCSPNGRCVCGHFCGGGCGCECACGCNQKKSPADNKQEYTYKHGKYEGVKYHHQNSKGNSRNGKSCAPIDGQNALDVSLQIAESAPRRIAVSDGQFVILDQTRNGIFHGHIREWGELEDDAKSVLIKAGLVTLKGKII